MKKISDSVHMTNYFIVPGYGGSGPDHWQTYFEKSPGNFKRINQKDWDHPDIDEWTETVDKAIAGYDPESVVLVAHSLGCLTVAEWVKRYNRKIKAALLVAPPDTDVINKKVRGKLFTESPTQRIPFPTTLVASTNDPWASIEKAEFYARQWGSEFINIGDAGHINAQSGLGEWKQGLEILSKLG
ncbi:MAG TPA: alpha/beta fold hydrolase [Paludibacter sp.]|nr:alpha/beta fold hydrolase [Paludibacter sp.]